MAPTIPPSVSDNLGSPTRKSRPPKTTTKRKSRRTADSGSGPVVISADGSAPGPIVISSSDSDDPPRTRVVDPSPSRLAAATRRRRKSRRAADSSGPIVISSDGSAPGPIVLSSDDDEPEVESPARKKGRVRENWPFSDQVKILTALAGHRQAGEELPKEQELFAELQHQLSRERFTPRDLGKKMQHLKDRFKDEVCRPSGARRRPQHPTLFNLSTQVWPDLHRDRKPQVVDQVVHISSSSSSPS